MASAGTGLGRSVLKLILGLAAGIAVVFLTCALHDRSCRECTPCSASPLATIELVRQPEETAPCVLETIHFESGSALLGPDAKRGMEYVAGCLERWDERIHVVGHADSQPVRGPLSNEELAVARALAVARGLVGLGLPAARIHVSGRGAGEPADPGRDERLSVNRRVEVGVVPRDGASCPVCKP